MNSPTATLFREAADELTRIRALVSFRKDFRYECGTCGAGTKSDWQSLQHTPECLITRLRVEAEKMEKAEACPEGYMLETRMVRKAESGEG